jgi:hypothetical protein
MSDIAIGMATPAVIFLRDPRNSYFRSIQHSDGI